MMHGDVGRDSSPPRWEGVAEGGEMKMNEDGKSEEAASFCGFSSLIRDGATGGSAGG